MVTRRQPRKFERFLWIVMMCAHILDHVGNQREASLDGIVLVEPVYADAAKPDRENRMFGRDACGHSETKTVKYR